MATRMQQRRGTAAQWTSADPILASAEIGFESDTGKFKIGDGINHWSDLTYYASAADIAGLIDGAPDLLNTLNELAAAIGDDADFVNTMASKTWVGTAIDNHSDVTTDVHGIANTADLATKTYAEDVANDAKDLAIQQASDDLSTHINDTTDVHGISNTADLVTTSQLESDISTHNGLTQNVHGILDTSELATKDYTNSAISVHQSDTTNIHGIVDTSALATKTYADNAVSSGLSTAETYADDAVSAHNLDTTSVHGIADTSVLVTQTDLSNTESSLQDNIDLKANIASPTFTGTVSGITKSMVGLGNVDNTADADKPVSTATQTALDLKANLAGPTFTGTTTAADLTITGDLTVGGSTTTVNATNLVVEDSLIYVGEGNSANLVDLGVVSSFNDGTYQHSGIVRDSSDGKWKIFKGVTDEPTTTINFAQGSLDALAVGALEATTVTPSSGVVFSDGTQTKEGVVSRTPIVQKTASYTLSALTERDSLIEISSASAVTLTIPANSSVAFPIGTSIDILQTSTGQITVAGAGGVTVNATPGLKLRTQWSGATLFKRATDTWVLYGDLTA